MTTSRGSLSELVYIVAFWVFFLSWKELLVLENSRNWVKITGLHFMQHFAAFLALIARCVLCLHSSHH
jgi:hypothetical protein